MDKEILAIGLSTELSGYISGSFEQEDHPVVECSGMSEARRKADSEAFSLIIFNTAALPPPKVQDAVAILRRSSYAPILALTSDEAVERVLEAGADCCLPPQTHRRRTAAYARALIRRYTLYNHYNAAEPNSSAIYRGELMIDPLRHRVTLAGEEITLQRREFRLLLYFARNPGIVLTAERICENAFETDYNYNIAPVVAKLRAKLKDDSRHPTYIETVYGTGYRFLPNT